MKIDQDVIEVLKRGEWGVYAKPTPTALTFRITEQLDRKMYLRVNDVLSAAGGRWVRAAKAHLFSDDQAATLRAAVEALAITTSSEMGFFPTPASLARELVYDWAEVEGGEHCLEPSAGTGAIARRLVQVGGHVTCVEVDKVMGKALVSEGIYSCVVIDDFLAPASPKLVLGSTGDFDVVVMNPPFSKPHGHDPIAHFERAWSLLRPHGRIVCVMPSGVKNNDSRRERDFREHVASIGGEIHDLPPQSFREVHTGVSTVVVRAWKGGRR